MSTTSAPTTTASAAPPAPVTAPTSTTTLPPLEKLDKLLASRSTPTELQDKNILMDPKVAPSLQGSQKELERALNQDRLATNLAHRPALETLVAEGIVQEGEIATS